jgi:pimeloyl-ACP methyl ester carboxylesterase
MGSEQWIIQNRIIPAAHTRQYVRGVRDEKTAHLRLAVNQFTPKDNPKPRRGDVSLIMVHGLNSAKECYEPFFDDLLSCSMRIGATRIRSIWSIDAAYNGASYLLNQDIIGDDPSWFDFTRDIWQMINFFQEVMPQPIVGIGQSLGCAHLLQLAQWHSRLFAGLILLEPALGPNGTNRWPGPPKYFPGVRASKRRDSWSSKEAARADFVQSRYYGRFDPRVLDRVVEYELCTSRTQSSNSYPSASSINGPVMLTTPKTMEVYMWMRPNPPIPGFSYSQLNNTPISASQFVPGFTTPEGPATWATLPHIYSPVLFIWAKESELSSRDSARARVVDVIGTGIGGGGGKAAGQVAEGFINGATHPVVLEKPAACADVAAEWLEEKIAQWDEEDARRDERPAFNVTVLSKEWAKLFAKL